MKTLYKFKFDCGRNGELQGLFIEDSERVRELVESGKEIYFGSVLGKHSEVCGSILEEEVIVMSTDPLVIKVVEENNLCFGFNPFDYSTKDCFED